MARNDKKKLNATYGYCTECEKFYKHGEYVNAYDQVLCKEHMAEYELNNTDAVRYFKSRQENSYR